MSPVSKNFSLSRTKVYLQLNQYLRSVSNLPKSCSDLWLMITLLQVWSDSWYCTFGYFKQIYRTLVYCSVLWSNSVLQFFLVGCSVLNLVLWFSIYSVICSLIRSVGLVFIWSSGFGLPYQFGLEWLHKKKS